MKELKETLKKIQKMLLEYDVMETQSLGKTIEYFQNARVYGNKECMRMTRNVEGISVGRRNEKTVSEILSLRKIENGYVLENLRVYEGFRTPVPKTALYINVNEQGRFQKGELETFGHVQGKFLFDIANNEKGDKITNFKLQKPAKKNSKEK